MRHKNADWNLPGQRLETWDQAAVAEMPTRTPTEAEIGENHAGANTSGAAGGQQVTDEELHREQCEQRRSEQQQLERSQEDSRCPCCGYPESLLQIDNARLDDILAEMKHRGIPSNCGGDNDGIECFHADSNLHPEDWCSPCLMRGLVARSAALRLRLEGSK